MAEKKIKVGINGGGCTAWSLARFMLRRNDVQLVAMNEPVDLFMGGDAQHAINRLEIDEMDEYGEMNVELKISRSKKSFFWDGKEVRFYTEKNFDKIRWDKVGVEVVVECTGLVTKKEEAAAHLKGGAKKVIISAPSDDAPMFIVGVNHHEYTSDLDVVSCGSSTTNCLAPLAKVINDKFGIVEGLLSTIHSISATQKSVEACGPSRPYSFPNLNPLQLAWRNEPEYNGGYDSESRLLTRVFPSCAAKDVGKVIPSLEGKLAGTSFRIIYNCVSVVDLTLKLEKAATYDEIKVAIKEESEGKMKGILSYLDSDIDKSDLSEDCRSCTFYACDGIALNANFVKLVAWYNNRVGFFHRIIDLILTVSK